MRVLGSFLAASALATFDLGVLFLAVRGLGGNYGRWRVALLTLAVLLKAAVLVGGLFYLGRQPWTERRALLAGVAAPFALFMLWQILKLRSAFKGGAA